MQANLPSLNGPVFWEVDEYVTNFVIWCFTENTRFYRVRDGLLGLQTKFPRLRGGLPNAWRTLGRWERTNPWRPRIPVAECLLRMLFLRALETSLTVQSGTALWKAFAVCHLVGFYGLRRPGELLRLRFRDIAFPLYRPPAQ